VTNEYARILEATEEHLRTLKAEGVRFLTVSGETLRQLREGAPAAPRFQTTASQVQIPVVQSRLVPTEPIEKKDVETAMAELRERAMACVKCPHLASSRKNVVFGVGNIHADLLFAGEAPGADEDRQGEPFVGAAGQLLTKIITAMGLSREKVYIANVLKCRPDTPGQTSGNRKPTGDEMKTCLPYLLEQIELIRPKAIVALGATAVEGLLGKTEPMGRMRGRFHEFHGTPLMPTFHPSYLLRNQAMSEKRKVWEDMLMVMEKLNLPITEKQRGYFLKA
jgi:DNA polymerase